MLRTAYKSAGVDEKDCVYVEAHGTGTLRGDPVELGALGNVLGRGSGRSQPLVIGSIKTSILIIYFRILFLSLFSIFFYINFF